MSLTRDSSETVVERAKRDPEFRVALLTEAAECDREGEYEVAVSLVRFWLAAIPSADRTSADLIAEFREFSRREEERDKSDKAGTDPSGDA